MTLRHELAKLGALFRRQKPVDDLAEEIHAHLAMEEQDNLERGMAPDEAHYAALRRFGNVILAQERSREMWGWNSLETLGQDIRYGLRMLVKNPGFTAVVTMTIALGVGINVGIFTVLNGAALRLLPIRRAEQVVSVAQIFQGRNTRNTHGEASMFSYSEYLEYRDRNQVFSGLLAYEPFLEATLANGSTRQLLGTASSCNYFDVLNERPAQGRGFVDADCAAPSENAVVVVSDDLWRGAFASDPALVGKRIILNRTPYTVVGIMPRGFAGTEPVRSEFWAPLTMQAALEGGHDRLADDNQSWLALLGRMRPGLTMEQVRANLGVLAGAIDRRHPGRSTSLAIHVGTFLGRPEEREVLLPVASVILAACGLVLLLACANVANLLLARASVRHKEVALRLSIGASRWRLVRQLLTESFLLSLMGGAVGSVLAFWSFASIVRAVTSRLPGPFSTLAVNVAPDARVFGYALGLTILTGMMFGLVPALEGSRLDLNTALKEDTSHSGWGKKRGRFWRNALVGAQIAVSMVLLLAAGLLLRGLYYAQTVDPGFETKHVATAFLNLRVQGYNESRAADFLRRWRERVERFPGVTEVAQAECAPLSHDYSVDWFSVPGYGGKVLIEYNHISPEYFSVVGIPIVRGRAFTPAEARDGAPVVIVTQSTAKRLWPNEDPLAKTLREDSGREDSVIGVAKDAQVSHLGELSTAYLYFPAGSRDSLRTYLLVRYAGNFAAIAKAIREVAESLDAEAPVDASRLEDNLETWRRPSRIVAALSGALGALALLLASIGVYGMASYSVSRRVREIGIRMALGADGSEVVRLVVKQAMGPVLLGGMVGIAGCAAVSSVFSAMLFGLSTHDPIAFISAPVFLLGVDLLACYIPARRATKVDPMVALRYE